MVTSIFDAIHEIASNRTLQFTNGQDTYRVRRLDPRVDFGYELTHYKDGVEQSNHIVSRSKDLEDAMNQVCAMWEWEVVKC